MGETLTTKKTYTRPLPNWITKTLIDEYEVIRKSGRTNMFDFYQVIRLAEGYGMEELPRLEKADYPTLLSFYSQAMEIHHPEKEAV